MERHIRVDKWRIGWEPDHGARLCDLDATDLLTLVCDGCTELVASGADPRQLLTSIALAVGIRGAMPAELRAVVSEPRAFGRKARL